MFKIVKSLLVMLIVGALGGCSGPAVDSASAPAKQIDLSEKEFDSSEMSLDEAFGLLYEAEPRIGFAFNKLWDAYLLEQEELYTKIEEFQAAIDGVDFTNLEYISDPDKFHEVLELVRTGLDYSEKHHEFVTVTLEEFLNDVEIICTDHAFAKSVHEEFLRDEIQWQQQVGNFVEFAIECYTNILLAYEFLLEHEKHWKIQDAAIMFDSDELMTSYDQLANTAYQTYETMSDLRKELNESGEAMTGDRKSEL